MSLKCSACQNPVPEGQNQCLVCDRGFASQLLCDACGSLVERGRAACPGCRSRRQESSPVFNLDRGAMVPTHSFQNEYGLVRGSTQYDAGEFGAISNVSVPDDVTAILSEIQRTIQSLLVLANRLSHCAGTPGSRNVINQCRNLATLLQEELETRRGP